MATRNLYIPESVSHPGTTLEEKLQEMGMSVKEFAVRSSKPEKTVIAIIKGDSSITPEMAVAFESITKIPANFWMNRQRIYDECVARSKRQAQIISFADWAKKFPYADMVNQGWIEKKTKQVEKTAVILDFFGISSPNAWENYYMNQQLKVAFRISLATTKEPYAISAWLRKGELQASEILVKEIYSDTLLKSKLPLMKDLMRKNSCDFAKQLQVLCAECGVKLIYTPCLKKAPVSGSTRWINNIPCIQLSGRSKRYDTFWFSFFHEIGHILLHGKKEIFLEDIEYDDAQKAKEKRGARVGCMVTRNSEVYAIAMRLAQARLSPPSFGQIFAEAAVNTPQEYFDAVYNEYITRRNVIVEGVNKIPGCFCPMPKGAFYTVIDLPVDDSDKFCQWLLTDFQYQGSTVMLAPATGFYVDPERGRHQARITYCLCIEDLKSAIKCLEEALKVYPGRLK